jgi:glycosyltransferase
LKISIITAVFNRKQTIAEAIVSLQKQSFSNFEHILIDGASNDGTLEVINELLDHRSLLQSEPDDGIYDAINKGIANSSGEIIGLLHSDDFFSDTDVLKSIADAFNNPNIDLVYGDLDYVDCNNASRVVRRWVSSNFSYLSLKNGWMPPHPTIFVRRRVLVDIGGYNQDYKISADYDFIVRYFTSKYVKALYIPRVLVKMRTGGKSNKNIKHMLAKSLEDYSIIKFNKIGGIRTLLFKNLSKVKQFF